MNASVSVSLSVMVSISITIDVSSVTESVDVSVIKRKTLAKVLRPCLLLVISAIQFQPGLNVAAAHTKNNRSSLSTAIRFVQAQCSPGSTRTKREAQEDRGEVKELAGPL